LIVLVWDPLTIVSASFQLSFFVVLSWPCSPGSGLDPQTAFGTGSPAAGPLRPRWHGPLVAALHYASAGLVTSLAHGSARSLWSRTIFICSVLSPLLANMLVVPLSSLALATSMGSFDLRGMAATDDGTVQLQRLALDALDGGPEPMGHDPARGLFLRARSNRGLFLPTTCCCSRCWGDGCSNPRSESGSPC